jgi:solute carrier family 6 amino acid transporter-like protein 5/7/9/14
VMRQKDDISDGIGMPDWRLSLCLFVSWLCVFLSIIKSIKSSGKLAYFFALFPYFVLITLLVRACTLEGSINGIVYFIKPDLSKVFNPIVWYNAIVQLFFSLALGTGTVLMYSGYNKFDHNIYR